MNIRFALETDLISIQKVIETAFSDEEKKVIINFASDLSTESSSPPIKSLVAEVDNQAIGYASYSPIFHKLGSSISGYILAPLAVSPKHQRQGIGSNLIKSGIEMLTKDGVDVLLVYGDPDYYRRFGFNKEIGCLFVPPYTLKHAFGWLGMMLNGTAVPDTSIDFKCVQSLDKPDLW